MGAVLTLPVIVMGDIGILVHIVIAKGDFGADVKLLGGDLAADVQLTQNLRDLICIQQIVIRYGFVGVGCLLCQGIVKSTCVEGLVIGVNAGVNHGNSGSCTGVAGGVGGGDADHGRGGGRIGVIRFLCRDCGGIIAGFQVHLLYAGDLLNGRNLTVRDIGRDDIGCQGQIPDHVQAGSCCTLNFRLDAALFLL